MTGAAPVSASASPTAGAESADSADPVVADRLRAAVRAVAAPDVVLAYSRSGRRTVVSGGTGPQPATPREELRYEIGSASKTFAALLLADLAEHGDVRLTDRAVARLPVAYGSPRRTGGRRRRAPMYPRPPFSRYGAHAHRDAITLLHLITHTSGLPPLPWDFYPQGLPRWRTEPYAGYSTARLLDAFARSHPPHVPGRRWRYSNFGVSLLAPVLTRATGTPYPELLTRRVLAPLGLRDTALAPSGPRMDATGMDATGTDATGHGKDGVTALPPLDAGAFVAAGGVRAAPGDLLRFLEAQLRPQDTPLHAALTAAQRPLLRRGLGHRHTHTLTWFRHPTAYGPLYFHAGATMGQEAFLGFRPGTDTAVVAVSTRRHSRTSALVRTAYDLLAESA